MSDTKKMKNVVIVGLGAIGGVYATALHDRDFGVRVAVDPERLARYRANPFIFNGVEYPFDYFTPSTGDEPADLVIIATKSPGYLDCLAMIEPIIGPDTQILPLLNGITSERLAIERYGAQHVIYGYFIGHTAAREGRSATQDGKYLTVFGEPTKNDPDQLSERVQTVKELFDAAAIRYRIDENMISSLWQKFIINVGLNQTTALYRKIYGELRSDPEAMATAVDLMTEAAEIAKALGIKGAGLMVDKALESLNLMAPEDSSSMLQDVVAGRPTEIDLFAGEVTRLGQSMGIPTPRNRQLIKVIH